LIAIGRPEGFRDQINDAIGFVVELQKLDRFTTSSLG
jgi:hypothetical protein